MVDDTSFEATRALFRCNECGSSPCEIRICCNKDHRWLREPSSVRIPDKCPYGAEPVWISVELKKSEKRDKPYNRFEDMEI